VDTLNDPMRVIGSRTIQGRPQQVPKIIACKIQQSTGFADEESASSIQAVRAPHWTAPAFAS
jgi:hypothetical protein